MVQMPVVFQVRISESLQQAIRDRAKELHVRPADVARMALAEAVTTPVACVGDGHTQQVLEASGTACEEVTL